MMENYVIWPWLLLEKREETRGRVGRWWWWLWVLRGFVERDKWFLRETKYQINHLST
jgi:hypothetical protein